MSKIEKLKDETARDDDTDHYDFVARSKINELIENQNRQEEAIGELALAAESGGWVGMLRNINQILNPTENK